MSDQQSAGYFTTGVLERAALLRRTIAFPDANDPRTVAAVRELVQRGTVVPVLIGEGPDVSGVQRLIPATDARREAVIELLLARRGDKGLTPGAAFELASHPLYFADALVALGHVDGCVAGAVHTTGEVVRAALWTVGTAPDVRTVSSAFYMLVNNFRERGAEVLTFTDCAVVPEPTARQLCDIVLAAAVDRRKIVGDEPIIAMLSYSTAGSADGESVRKVREALALVRAEAPLLRVDGELQGDAALIASVAARKIPSSTVAGDANVLVFPSLDAGNLAYKLVQRLAGAVAVGPILQGMARPCSDLSRGASVGDIVLVSAVTALQAG